MSGKVGESGIQVVRSLVEEETPRTRSENEERVHELFNGYVPDSDDWQICRDFGIPISDLTGGTLDAEAPPSPPKDSDSPFDSDPDYEALLEQDDWLLKNGLVKSPYEKGSSAPIQPVSGSFQIQPEPVIETPVEKQKNSAHAAEPKSSPQEMLSGQMLVVETSYRSSSSPRKQKAQGPVQKQEKVPIKRVRSLSSVGKDNEPKDVASPQTVKKPIESPLLTTASVSVYRNFVVTKYKEPWARMCMDENYIQQKPVQNKLKYNPEALPQERLKEDWKLVQATVPNVSLDINSTPADSADQQRIQREIIGSGFENEQIYIEVCQPEKKPTPIDLTDSLEFSDRSQ